MLNLRLTCFHVIFFQESANTSGVKDNGPQTLVHAISAPSSVTDDLVPHRLRKKAKHLSDLSDDSEDSELLATQQLPHHLSIRYCTRLRVISRILRYQRAHWGTLVECQK